MFAGSAFPCRSGSCCATVAIGVGHAGRVSYSPFGRPSPPSFGGGAGLQVQHDYGRVRKDPPRYASLPIEITCMPGGATHEVTRAVLEDRQAIPRGRDFRFVPVGGFGLKLGPII